MSAKSPHLTSFSVPKKVKFTFVHRTSSREMQYLNPMSAFRESMECGPNFQTRSLTLVVLVLQTETPWESFSEVLSHHAPYLGAAGAKQLWTWMYLLGLTMLFFNTWTTAKAENWVFCIKSTWSVLRWRECWKAIQSLGFVNGWAQPGTGPVPYLHNHNPSSSYTYSPIHLREDDKWRQTSRSGQTPTPYWTWGDFTAQGSSPLHYNPSNHSQVPPASFPPPACCKSLAHKAPAEYWFTPRQRLQYCWLPRTPL